MNYREIRPKVALTSHIQNYWEFDASDLEGEPYLHHVPPDGCVSLVFAKTDSESQTHTPGKEPSRLIVMGPRLTELKIPIEPGGIFWGMRFWPDSAGNLLQVKVTHLKNGVGPLSHHSPALHAGLLPLFEGASQIEDVVAALDVFWEDRLAPSEPLDPVVRAGMTAIILAEGQIPIADIATNSALSERQFTRRFQAAVGLTPKQFARIRRFRSSASAILDRNPQTWSRVAMDLGYSDQAHMSREFSELSGLSPRKFREHILSITHHDVKP